jgi:hypothetical protein
MTAHSANNTSSNNFIDISIIECLFAYTINNLMDLFRISSEADCSDMRDCMNILANEYESRRPLNFPQTAVLCVQ